MKAPVICLKALFLLGVLLVTATWSRADNATATFTTSTVSPGVYQYDFTLADTGTTDVGTFWFSWIPGFGFMSASPTNVESPSGWTDQITNSGGAIRWVATTPITLGSSVTGFEFDSTLAPSQLEAASTAVPSDPVDTYFIYSGAPFSDAGAQLVATPAVAATPEPGTLALSLLTVSLLAFARCFRRHNRLAW